MEILEVMLAESPEAKYNLLELRTFIDMYRFSSHVVSNVTIMYYQQKIFIQMNTFVLTSVSL